MNKKERTNIIRKNAREQIKIYNVIIKEIGRGMPEAIDCESKIRGIRQFLINLEKIGIIAE